MLDVDIPGFGKLRLANLVADFNGTLAVDGKLLPGVASRIGRLAQTLSIHVLTADTHGTARQQTHGLPARVTVIGAANQAGAKLDYVRALDCATVAAVGNGRNDRDMLAAAALGIAIVQGEGAARDAVAAADVAVPGIVEALDLLLLPLRLVATLRA